MQDFQDNEKILPFWILLVQNLYPLFFIHGPAILHFFELRKYHKIIKIQNGHLTATLKLFAPKC